MSAGYALSLDGCPLLFRDGTSTSLPTSTDADWSTAWTAACLLETPQISWTERIHVIDGDMDVEAQTFQLHDASLGSGITGSYPCITYLTTRSSENIVGHKITGSISAAALSITILAGGASYPSGSQVIYVDQEAILCDSRSGNVFTVNASGRGYYGSLAVAHTTTTDVYGASGAAVAWRDFPGFHRRRVILWRVSGAGVATPLWRGICGITPRLARGGAMMEIQAEHLWTRIADLPLGPPAAGAHLSRFNSGGIQLGLRPGDNQLTVNIPWTGLFVSTSIQPTLDDALTAAVGALQRQADSVGVEATMRASVLNDAIHFEVTVPTATMVTVAAQIAGGKKESVTWEGNHADLDLTELPSALVYVDPGNSAYDLPVDNTLSMPTLGYTAASPDGFRTSTAPVFRGAYSDDLWLDVSPSSYSSYYSTLTGSAKLTPRTSLGRPSPRPFWVTEALYLKATACITTEHWAHGLRYGVVAGVAGLTQTGLDARDWEWSGFDRLVRLRTGPSAARKWFFDGSTKFGPTFTAICRYEGAALAIRNSRFSPIVIQPPIATDVPVATLTKADILGVSLWSHNDDGLVNCAEVETNDLKVLVRDVNSVSRYGPTRTVKLELKDGVTRGSDPRSIAQNVLRNVIGMFSEPTYLATIKCRLDKADAIQTGDYISVTEPFMPNGDGTRGWATKVVQVVGRTPSTREEDGSVTLFVLDYGRPALSGYAPAARCASGATPSNFVNIDINYIAVGSAESGLPTDYAGSDQAGYTGSANDGGVTMFVAGDRVQLRVIDEASPPTPVSMIVASTDVTGGLRVINFTSSLPTSPYDWPAKIAAGVAKIDVVYDAWDTSGFQTAQQNYAAIGSYTTDVIGNSTTKPKFWSP